MIKYISLFISICVVCGCAPGLGSSISINSIPQPEKNKFVSELVGARVIPFVDTREKTTVAEIDGREIAPNGDVGNTVRAAVENYLRSVGVYPKGFDVPTVGGSVERWFVTVKPGFPVTEVSSSASIKIEVINREGKPVFRRRYGGESVRTEPMVNEDKIATILGDAMSAALEQASDDKELIEQIQKASS